RAFLRMANPNRGVDPTNVLTMHVTMAQARELRPKAEIIDFEHRVIDRLRALPGVDIAPAPNNVPSRQGSGSRDVIPDGRDARPGGTLDCDYRPMSPAYLDLLRVPLIDGRALRATDDANAPPVAVVSTNAAWRLWPEGSPIGKRFRWDGPANNPWITVV